jgi:hypothetical protein
MSMSFAKRHRSSAIILIAREAFPSPNDLARKSCITSAPEGGVPCLVDRAPLILMPSPLPGRPSAWRGGAALRQYLRRATMAQRQIRRGLSRHKIYSLHPSPALRHRLGLVTLGEHPCWKSRFCPKGRINYNLPANRKFLQI